MIIGGLQKFSVLDYPEHLAAIIFTQGCNFRCQFCYNPLLVWPQKVGKFENSASKESSEAIKEGHLLIQEGVLFDFLKKRIGKLDAVVITGGEPTMHEDLEEFIGKIKRLGYKVKLDSNGTNPTVIQSLLDNNLLDYIAMDIKTSLAKYDLLTGVQPDLAKIRESVIIIKDSGLPHEFRTTVVPELVDSEDIKAMGKIIAGGEKWFLQKFKSDTELVNKSFEKTQPTSDEHLEKMREIANKYVKVCLIR
jgi:pyruvate formate lyase activating enzyme